MLNERGDHIKGPSAAAGAEGLTRYLVIEGRAGGGTWNGECSVVAAAANERELSKLLSDHVALEKELTAGDRNEARCLGELSEREIAGIPDRKTGLSIWILDTEMVHNTDHLEGDQSVLREFHRQGFDQPHFTFSVDIVDGNAPSIAALLLTIARKRDASRTIPP